MSKRFYTQNNEILDNGFFIGSTQDIVDILNKQDDRIEELENKLSNAIVSNGNNPSQFVDLLNKEMYELKIANLEAKLAESEKENKRISSGNLSHAIYVDKKIERLEQQLAGKNKLLREKIGNMKSNEFIKMCIDCGFMVDAKEKHNQDKIELLEKVDKKVDELVDDYAHFDYSSWCVYIDTLIKEIRGE